MGSLLNNEILIEAQASAKTKPFETICNCSFAVKDHFCLQKNAHDQRRA